jgi:hypothetical protein
MSKTAPQKFNFTRSFEDDGTVNEGAGSWRRSIPREEVEALKAKEFDRGRDSEMVQAEQSTQRVVKNIDTQLAKILTQYSEMAAQNRKDAAFLAQTIAGKIAGAALGKFGVEQVSTLIKQTLLDLKGNPRVKITVTETVAGELTERLAVLSKESEFSGSMVIEIDAEATAGSVSLDWGEGAVSFNPVEIEARIKQEVANWLLAEETSAPPTQISEEGNNHGGQ